LPFPSGPASFLRLPLLAAVVLAGCVREDAEPPFVPNTGQIQVLNGCGKTGIAEVFREFLTRRGFDVIEFGNAGSWNYDRTLVISRAPSDRIALDLAKVLGTGRVLHLRQEPSLSEATVVIGKDYEELMRTWPQPSPSNRPRP
jgi:hypothetical protein